MEKFQKYKGCTSIFNTVYEPNSKDEWVQRSVMEDATKTTGHMTYTCTGIPRPFIHQA